MVQTCKVEKIFKGVLSRGISQKIKDTVHRVPTIGFVSVVVGVQRDEPFIKKYRDPIPAKPHGSTFSGLSY